VIRAWLAPSDQWEIQDVNGRGGLLPRYSPWYHGRTGKSSLIFFERGREDSTRRRSLYKRTFLSLRAFATTDTELKLIAAAAIIGLSRIPKKG
jgi:hypothetical protein